MALTMAAVVPHSPLLLERIGGERTASLGPTLEALHQLAGEIAQARVETLVVIGDHGSLQPGQMTLCQPPTLHLQLRQFGDVATDRTWPPDAAFGNAVRAYGETNLPLCTVAPDELGYAVGVPLLLLTEHSPNIRVSCFGPALLPAEDHRSLGAAIRFAAEQSASRVAVVAAGDVPEGSAEFIAAVADALAGKTDTLLDSRWADTPQAMAWRTLSALVGVVEGIALAPEIAADQRVFDTGLFTAILRQ